jgi:hypothetical protein
MGLTRVSTHPITFLLLHTRKHIRLNCWSSPEQQILVSVCSIQLVCVLKRGHLYDERRGLTTTGHFHSAGGDSSGHSITNWPSHVHMAQTVLSCLTTVDRSVKLLLVLASTLLLGFGTHDHNFLLLKWELIFNGRSWLLLVTPFLLGVTRANTKCPFLPHTHTPSISPFSLSFLTVLSYLLYIT